MSLDPKLIYFYSSDDLANVKVHKIKELGRTKKGRKLNLFQHELSQETGYPVYSSKTLNDGILGYLPTYDYDQEAITWSIVGASAGTVFYRHGKFTINDNCGLLVVNNKEILTKYLYYFLSVNSKKYVNDNSTLTMMNCNFIDNIEVPVPSLGVQEKIVSFLDLLKEYITNITSGLPAEIQAREKQYQYYLETLLNSFKESI